MEVLDVVNPDGTGNLWYVLGSLISGVVAIAVFMRTKLSRDGTQIATDRTERGLLNYLSVELEKANERVEQERKARYVAEQRADAFAAERNDLTMTVGKLHGTIQSLETRIQSLEQRLMESHGRYPAASSTPLTNTHNGERDASEKPGTSV